MTDHQSLGQMRALPNAHAFVHAEALTEGAEMVARALVGKTVVVREYR